MKWSFVGDLQIPYQHKRAVELYFKAMKWWKPDAIDIVGDIDDQLEYSTFSDGTTDEFFSQIKNNYKQNDKIAALIDKANKTNNMKLLHGHNVQPLNTNPMPFIFENARGAKEFYTDLRKAHHGADIHSSLGNHDIRIFKYMDKKAPEYNDQLTVNALWGLDDLGITWRQYELPPLKRYANVYVHHGATTSDSGLAVKGDIDKYNISLVRGHDHRGGVVYKSYPISGQTLVGMGTGHLCDPHAYGLRYTINPSWEMGFGVAHVDGDTPHMQFIPIKEDENGFTLILDGKKFSN